MFRYSFLQKGNYTRLFELHPCEVGLLVTEQILREPVFVTSEKFSAKIIEFQRNIGWITHRTKLIEKWQSKLALISRKTTSGIYLNTKLTTDLGSRKR
jgi:hypothetical protein